MTTVAQASAQTGTTAPAFTATDSKGRQHSLAAYKGKTVVLEWTNHECPYTVKHYATGNMQALQAAATAPGIVWLTVVSSRPGEQGFVNAMEADQLTETRDARPTAVLLDPEGQPRPALRRPYNPAHVHRRSRRHAGLHGRHRRSADGQPGEREGCPQLRARGVRGRARRPADRRSLDAARTGAR